MLEIKFSCKTKIGRSSSNYFFTKEVYSRHCSCHTHVVSEGCTCAHNPHWNVSDLPILFSYYSCYKDIYIYFLEVFK